MNIKKKLRKAFSENETIEHKAVIGCDTVEGKTNVYINGNPYDIAWALVSMLSVAAKEQNCTYSDYLKKLKAVAQLGYKRGQAVYDSKRGTENGIQ